jgi:hypothetical protein
MIKKFIAILPLLFLSKPLFSFCGFYVAKADTKLFNKVGQVVMVRNEGKTVISMMNDYQGELKNFAMVVPVPQILQKEQINVGKRKLFERIDSFTAPRLVEYFDKDPCEPIIMKAFSMERSATGESRPKKGPKGLGVTVHASYTVGEYDIVILGAQESNGLETWLHQNGYNIPKGAKEVLAPYIKQNMKFFVAKINLKEQVKTGLTYLRPLQMAFDSTRFMLPIRLGMLNSNGPQELFIFLLTKNGRVETTNYRTVPLPTDKNIPVYVKEEFPQFYRALFNTMVKREGMNTLFMEYFWDMGWCDPCAADPLTATELRELGVFWLDDKKDKKFIPGRPWGGNPNAQPVKVTRLHVRYTKDKFPADLMFQETNDKRNYQARYILNHPWKGSPEKCDMAKKYFAALPGRLEKEAQNLANLTGFDINEIRKKINKKQFKGEELLKGKIEKRPWWKKLWNKSGS